MIVPEAMSLTQMLKEARRRHSQMALVVDEFGTFVGLVTIEDVLEQIVGEIQDEYDREEAAIRKVGENVLVVDASMSLRDLASERDIVLPRGRGVRNSGGVCTGAAGLLFPRAGRVSFSSPAATRSWKWKAAACRRFALKRCRRKPADAETTGVKNRQIGPAYSGS